LPECTNIDLENARSRKKIPRWKLATMLGVSESTIARWENGEVQPEPDDVDRFASAVGDVMLWHRWMLNNYESYRKRYFEAVDQSLPVSIARSRFEMEDVMRMHDRVERDALDGTIDDIQLKTAYTKEIKDAIAALCDTLQRLESTDSATPEGR
jgi:transcriptional regulator with XRE-family HTH domain